ncbi:UDP-N-acetylmuramate--L-alanine ligase [bacterium]|nr:UDP-N-acetylmuramate--L-alanine ligase [bacterium]
MTQLDMFRRVKNIHMVGIGGTGMCGIAEILLEAGFTVSGSDMARSATTDRLIQLGARVWIGHRAEQVEGADVVVISSAVDRDNVEQVAARERHIPVIRRAEMLAELMRMKYGIAVAGTHGKTTTTSMIGQMLEHAGLDPTVIVGGRLRSLGRNARSGAGDILVAEADEFDRSFLRLTPSVAIITNIDREHMDCYNSLDELKDAFVEFANKVPFYGALVTCLDDPLAVSIIPRLERRLVTYGGSAQADLQHRDIVHQEGGTHCRVYSHGAELGELHLQVPGEHNVKNALAALGVGLELGLDFGRMSEGLAAFSGVHRRSEVKGEAAGRMVVDDYAHHPTEVRATLEGLKKAWNRRIVAVFQPHLYSRTRDQVEEFGRSFMHSDILVVTAIYGAREKPIPGVSAESVAEAARNYGHRQVLYAPEREALAEAVVRLSQPGDMIVTLGAGDIYKVGEQVLTLLGESKA